MARIVEERIVIVFSRIVANKQDDLGPVLDDDQIETLQTAIEGLVDDSSIIVELGTI